MSYKTRYTIDFQDPVSRERLPVGGQKFRQMYQARAACVAAGLEVPAEVREFFSQTGAAIAAELVQNEEALFVLGMPGLSSGASGPWYEHERDLRELSAKFPAVLIVLKGEGVDAGDLWKKYFLSGTCQDARAQIIYPEFDPEKLS